ncbi:leucine Rich repeat-containing domain protein [Ostertagia ostertagi]
MTVCQKHSAFILAIAPVASDHERLGSFDASALPGEYQGCDIDDISICERMVNIEVLSLSVNRVETLQPLRNCTRLVELYLRKNNIESLTELEYLKDLRNLRVLWIDENPCTRSGDYRHRVLRILPQLTKLDDKREFLVLSLCE